MGLGMIFIIPLTKKVKKRVLFMIGCVMIVAGNAVCLTEPDNMTIVIIGQIIKNVGCIPSSYIFMALFADTLDYFEWRHHFRCDGFAMSVYSIILTVATGICTSVFNLILGMTGYQAPTLLNGVTTAAQQSAATTNAILWCYYGVELVGTIVLLVMYFFMKSEYGLKEKQAELAAQRDKQ